MASFFTSRLGIDTALADIADAPVLGGASWGRAFGAASATCLVVAGLTGIGLSFSYSAGTAGAWASVYATEHVLAGGWYLRSLHMLAAEGSIVMGVLAVLLSAFEGRYRDRRDVAFLSLALTVGLVFAFAITGNALHWDDRGYFGFLVETNVIGAMPLGGLQRSLLLGGSQPGNWTLTRVFTLHGMLLPLVAVALATIWITSGCRASTLRARAGLPSLPYGQKQLFRDVAISALALLAVAAVTLQFMKASRSATSISVDGTLSLYKPTEANVGIVKFSSFMKKPEVNLAPKGSPYSIFYYDKATLAKKNEVDYMKRYEESEKLPESERSFASEVYSLVSGLAYYSEEDLEKILFFAVGGDSSAILGFEFEDAKGKKITPVSTSSTSVVYTYYFAEKPDPVMKVLLNVESMKSVKKVPFSLLGIDLP